MRRLVPLAVAAVLLGGCPPCLQPGVDDCATLRAVNAAALRATTWLLEAEAFGRRDVPAPGSVRAAHVAAAQLQAAGLQPGGDHDTFLQAVPLTLIEPRQPALALIQDAVEVTLAPARDFQVLEAHGEAQVKVDAEVVLADGDPPPDRGWLRGRAALLTVRTPDDTPRAAAAVTRLRAQGAAGVLLCTRGPRGRDAYHQLRERLQRPLVRLADDGARAAAATAPAAAPGVRVGTAASAPAPAARLVLALSPPACEQLLATAAAATGQRGASPVLPLRVRAQARLEHQAARAWNAVGVYRAARDPRAAPLVVTAPLDGPAVDVAALLDAGRALVQLRARPPRPVVLVATAGAPGAPVGLAHFERHAGRSRPAPLRVALREVPPARVALETARLIEAILRGAAPVAAP